MKLCTKQKYIPIIPSKLSGYKRGRISGKSNVSIIRMRMIKRISIKTVIVILYCQGDEIIKPKKTANSIFFTLRVQTTIYIGNLRPFLCERLKNAVDKPRTKSKTLFKFVSNTAPNLAPCSALLCLSVYTQTSEPFIRSHISSSSSSTPPVLP